MEDDEDEMDAAAADFLDPFVAPGDEKAAEGKPSA